MKAAIPSVELTCTEVSVPGSALPRGFECLSEFAREWGHLTTNVDRYLKRQSSTLEQLRAFYDAVTPLLDKAFTYLDTFPYGELPDREARLFRTLLGVIEAAQAVEVFNAARLPRAPFPHQDYRLEEF